MAAIATIAAFPLELFGCPDTGDSDTRVESKMTIEIHIDHICVIDCDGLEHRPHRGALPVDPQH